MEHKSDSDETAPSGDVIWGEDDVDAEFDEAVTSEIKLINIVPISGGNAEHDVYDGADTDLDQTVVHSPTADDASLQPGFSLGDRFEIVSLVHSGGMGHVYKAIDHHRHAGGSEQPHVAIKMIRQSIASRLDANLALEREAAKTQHLAHPNIVNVFDFDQHGEQFYLVMEWLQGESLNALLRRTSGQRLEPHFAWRIVEGVAAGLQHAHANNVVHADVNPSNIFITETQEIKLLDFGVARYANDAEMAPQNNADKSTVWATRSYASPELLSGMAPGFEDDIFSLGCVAYRLMSGAHPFSGLSSIDAMNVETVPPCIPGLSDAQWQTLRRALSFKRSDRPNSASDFITDVAAAPETDLTLDVFGRSAPRWWLAVAAAAVVAVAAFWWSSQKVIEPTSAPAPLGDSGSALSPEALALSAEADALVRSAAAAMDEARLVEPAGDNARDLYREALLLVPLDERALGGLRAISDVYVQRATAALRSGDIETATGALTTAMETSPENPSVAIVKELIAAQGGAQLAKAELAFAGGDTDQTLALLSEAERYGTIDVGAINALRSRITQSLEEQQFLDALVTADSHLSAGRLIAPVDNNAYALLANLKGQRGDDSRLGAATERLGERLLTRAAFETAAGRFVAASEMLDAAKTLGVLQQDVAAGQRSLTRARARAATARSAAAESAAVPAAVRPSPAAVAPVESASTNQAAQVTRADAEAPPATVPAGRASPPETTSDASVAEAADASTTEVASGAGSASIDGTPPRMITLSDLAIEKYVAPKFPRSARRRGLEGLVTVRFRINADGSTGDIETLRAEPGRIFTASAEKAISQWRFAPRDDVVTTQITLSFLLEP